MKLEIEKMLILSTRHLRESTAKTLPQSEQDEPSSIEAAHWWPQFTREEGWLFYVPPVAHEDTRYVDAPEELRAIVALARAHGCAWVMLDRDGPQVDLPGWEW